MGYLIDMNSEKNNPVEKRRFNAVTQGLCPECLGDLAAQAALLTTGQRSEQAPVPDAIRRTASPDFLRLIGAEPMPDARQD